MQARVFSVASNRAGEKLLSREVLGSSTDFVFHIWHPRVLTAEALSTKKIEWISGQARQEQ